LRSAWLEHGLITNVRRPGSGIAVAAYASAESGQRDIPPHRPAGHAEPLREPEQAVEHVLARAGLDLRVGEDPLAFAGAVAVEPHAMPRRHHQRGHCRARCQLHVQQRVELAAPQSRPQVAIALHAGLLVERDELDARDVAEQLVLEVAEDPRDLRRRPGVLQRAHHGQHVAHVAERRESQDADRLGRCAEQGQLHRRLETVGSGAGIVNNPHR
jgi:hypothetical protein